MQTNSQEIQQDLDAAKERVRLYESALRLFGNPEYQKIIKKGYLHDFALKLIRDRAKPDIDIGFIDKQLDAIAFLQSYITSILEDGPIAYEEVKTHGESLENYLLEDTRV